MKIYTKTGDKGTTALFDGKRISKDSTYLWAYGTVDELNAVIGMAIAQMAAKPTVFNDLDSQLKQLQRELFQIGADLATPLETKKTLVRISESMTKNLETWIDGWDLKLTPLKRFILPGGSIAASTLHQARCICRRAERHTFALSQEVEINTEVLIYLNRLSDFLFTAARAANMLQGETDFEWQS